ncbi:ethanolamine transporter [Keratinibaculum paraultunense]|uniref:Ethanolamine transporter n=1 Tax=Keratinibaculum paraultunense TaxID=1278232 RepID=A0A4R3KZ84_9FIRM|nr:ethanolamine utilization protein EutH [Keratinibaculum paraultunense]QQY80053.1 ethanolamine utilization protein EutH [Keratinibaculum paraultunense]TCS91626.1 ethanolamine transporter [Keratinibaculum paraultunense]
MSDIVLWVMVIFSIIGGIDKLLNNKYGLGRKFEEGFEAMGGLVLSMIGIISLAPAIAQFLMPILSYLSKITHADPSVFTSSILAIDMGGYAISVGVAKDQNIAKFTGLILSSMMGATVSFTIPIAINMIAEEDFAYFAKGILAGIITIPIGMLIGGIAMKLEYKYIFINLIPVVVLAIIIAIGLVKFQQKMIRVFVIIGKIIIAISTIGLLISILGFIFNIKLISNMMLFEEGLTIIGKIVVILSGAYPFFHFIYKIMNKPLNNISKKLGINEFSCLGIITSLANCVPMIGIYDKMDNKGKVMNAAFAVSGAFTFGGQLGYITTISKDMIIPFILAKLSAGISSIVLANQLVVSEEKL